MNESATKTYFTPTGTNSEGVGSIGALNFVNATHRHYATYNSKIYVISTLNLVSSVTGAILGTNENTDANNPYKFVVSEGGHRLERYANYTAFAGAGYNSSTVGSFGANLIGDGEMWSFVDGALKWNNCTLG